jgi:hypothetical protein
VKSSSFGPLHNATPPHHTSGNPARLAATRFAALVVATYRDHLAETFNVFWRAGKPRGRCTHAAELNSETCPLALYASHVVEEALNLCDPAVQIHPAQIGRCSSR